MLSNLGGELVGLVVFSSYKSASFIDVNLQRNLDGGSLGFLFVGGGRSKGGGAGKESQAEEGGPGEGAGFRWG